MSLHSSHTRHFTHARYTDSNLISLSHYFSISPCVCFVYFSPFSQPHRESLRSSLFSALDEVVIVALLSNERMFKGLLLDLDAIHRDTEVDDSHVIGRVSFFILFSGDGGADH